MKSIPNLNANDTHPFPDPSVWESHARKEMLSCFEQETVLRPLSATDFHKTDSYFNFKFLFGVKDEKGRKAEVVLSRETPSHGSGAEGWTYVRLGILKSGFEGKSGELEDLSEMFGVVTYLEFSQSKLKAFLVKVPGWNDYQRFDLFGVRYLHMSKASYDSAINRMALEPRLHYLTETAKQLTVAGNPSWIVRDGDRLCLTSRDWEPFQIHIPSLQEVDEGEYIRLLVKSGYCPGPPKEWFDPPCML